MDALSDFSDLVSRTAPGNAKNRRGKRSALTDPREISDSGSTVDDSDENGDEDDDENSSDGESSDEESEDDDVDVVPEWKQELQAVRRTMIDDLVEIRSDLLRFEEELSERLEKLELAFKQLIALADASRVRVGDDDLGLV